MTEYKNTIQKEDCDFLLNKFLDKHFMVGTTCYNKTRDCVWQNGRFAILRKRGHSENMGRWQPRGYCKTIFSLVDLKSPNNEDASNYSRGFKDWVGGKWTKKRQMEAELEIHRYIQVDYSDDSE